MLQEGNNVRKCEKCEMKLMRGKNLLHLRMGSSAIIISVRGMLGPWKSQLSAVKGL